MLDKTRKGSCRDRVCLCLVTLERAVLLFPQLRCVGMEKVMQPQKIHNLEGLFYQHEAF